MDQKAFEVYEQWHESIEAGGEDVPDAPWHLMVRAHLAGVDLKGKTVLEIACGRGGFSKWLAEQGAVVTAADFSASAVRITRQRLASFSAARVEEQDLERLTYADESFDLVISLETLEHLPHPLKGMDELVRVTRRGGSLLVTGPNYLSITGLYRFYLRLRGRTFTECGQPINQLLFLPSQIRRFRRRGCRIERVAGVGHYVLLPRHDPVRIRVLDRLQWLTKWTALHGMIAATRA